MGGGGGGGAALRCLRRAARRVSLNQHAPPPSSPLPLPPSAFLPPRQRGWLADRIGLGHIAVIGRDGSGLRTLTQPSGKWPAFVPGAPFPTFRGDVTPAWSPDGARIAYASQAGAGGNYEVVSVDASAGGSGGVRRQTVTASQPHVTVGWQPAQRAP